MEKNEGIHPFTSDRNCLYYYEYVVLLFLLCSESRIIFVEQRDKKERPFSKETCFLLREGLRVRVPTLHAAYVSGNSVHIVGVRPAIVKGQTWKLHLQNFLCGESTRVTPFQAECPRSRTITKPQSSLCLLEAPFIAHHPFPSGPKEAASM